MAENLWQVLFWSRRLYYYLQRYPEQEEAITGEEAIRSKGIVGFLAGITGRSNYMHASDRYVQIAASSEIKQSLFPCPLTAGS